MVEQPEARRKRLEEEQQRREREVREQTTPEAPDAEQQLELDQGGGAARQHHAEPVDRGWPRRAHGTSPWAFR